MSEYFPKPKTIGGKVKVGLEINEIGVNTLNFAKKTDLAHLKSYVDKLDTDKFLKIYQLV